MPPLEFKGGTVQRMSPEAFEFVRERAPDAVLDFTPKGSTLAVHGLMMKAKLPPITKPEVRLPSPPAPEPPKRDFWHLLGLFRGVFLRLIGR